MSVNGIGETIPLCYSMHKNQFKYIKNLNVGPEIENPQQEVGESGG